MAQNTFRFLYLTVFIGFLWVMFYSLNRTLLKITEITPYISLIFIPSGFKIACAAIYRKRSILGIFLGSLITGFLFLKSFSIVDVVAFSCLSAMLPFIALLISERLLSIKADLSNLSIKHIVVIGGIYAMLNGFFHIAYRYHVLFLRDPHKLLEFFLMMTGDVFGILLFMVFVAQLSRSVWIQKRL